ncbi:MAG TPA: choice-of-anchor tandem repeat GloVer-containing protein [Candidatus Cybelea sp.]|nr:choice-of-anchor tandem repeat GloVer-containing protein [Candidatus Cybelea sp.]
MRLSPAAKSFALVVALGALLAGCAGGAQITPPGGLGAAFHARAMGSSDDVLYAFTDASTDGYQPYGDPVEDSKGALYGTTSEGSGNDGDVWKLTPSGKTYKETALYKFASNRKAGAAPEAGLVMDSSGALYGTTSTGGSGSCGCGVIFALTPKGTSYTESTLYDFGTSSGKDGAASVAALTLSGSELFGVTNNGGSGACTETPPGCGTVFEISTKGTGYKVLYDFKGGKDGAYPQSSVIVGKGGVLYGVTANGGGSKVCPAGCGTAFSLTPKGGKYTESVLWRFAAGSGTDGEIPSRGRGLYLASDDTLVGTTTVGGSGSCAILFVSGCGVVFALTPKGKSYTESIPYTFQGGTDAQEPNEELTPGKGGVLYGTGSLAGGGAACTVGCGVIFELTPAKSGYTESIVYSFQAGKDGARPYGGVIVDKSGDLLGTTSLGGGSTHCGSGCGTVFEMKP